MRPSWKQRLSSHRFQPWRMSWVLLRQRCRRCKKDLRLQTGQYCNCQPFGCGESCPPEPWAAEEGTGWYSVCRAGADPGRWGTHSNQADISRASYRWYPQTPFGANTLLWTPFGATQTKGYADIDRMSEYPLFFQTLWYQRLLRFTAQLRDPFILPIEPFFALFVPRYKRNQFEIVQL